MRSVPGQQFTFDWNPSVGINPGLAHADVAYPGDQWVDRIALDVYDGWYNRGWAPGSQQPSQAERDVVWDEVLNGPRGLNYWRSFASTHGKHVSFPEWGLQLWTVGDGLIHGGGDNASFISRMSAIINDPAWNIDYHAFWEQRGYGVMDPDSDSARIVAVPQSRAVFLSQLGGGAAPLPQVTTSSTPPTQLPSTTLGTLPASSSTTAPAPTTTTTASTPPSGSDDRVLLRALDLGGPDHQWESRPYAAHDGETPVPDFTTNGLVTCLDPAAAGTPPDSPELAEIVRCGLAKDPQQPPLTLTFTNLAPGRYEVVLVTTDLDPVTGSRPRATAFINGEQRRLERPATDGGWWMRRRPWKLEVTGTSLELTFPDDGLAPSIAAVELWQSP